MATLEIRKETGRRVWTWHCENATDQQKALERAEDQVGDGWIVITKPGEGELLVVLYDYDYYPEEPKPTV